MIRFISFLFNKPYETCKSCETLKAELAFERAEKKELLGTLIGIINPKILEAAPTHIPAMVNSPAALTFSRKRAALEARDRESARIASQSNVIGKPDNPKDDVTEETIAKLETELGIESEVKEG